MPHRTRALVAVVLLAGLSLVASAQSSRETERKLERVRTELKSIAQERRKLEGERGTASRQLRDADEKVSRTTRSLSETEAALRQEEAALAELQQKRDTMRTQLDAQRRELATLVRAAYQRGDDAPLKVLLSQDRVADANRLLAYHRYVQRDQAQRITAVTAELASLDQVEQEIVARREGLDAARAQQRAQMAQLQKDRQTRAGLVADLDERYQDRAAKEKALGQDAKALERLLKSLRDAAARAERERREAARREAAAAAAAQKREGNAPARTTRTSTPRPAVASAPPLKVGGLGWPVSGNLLARYGGRLPDGRASTGVLIGAPSGTPVTAVADGTVVFSEWMTGYGLILILDHGNGYMSLYAHNDSLLKDSGDRVKRGDAVARVGTSGGQGQAALYFELRRNGQPVDPSSWLQRR
ncbi:peptidoglycan DD-metalloendopeptidase family protein [Pseudoxanthomonas sp. PXM02]|uniref:murein hydrolase activator EnvC family protein n=1 Tax=Pseudoxanthomonas sp. PXM02 TaxID=2769294 RepID=UPI00178602B8|nr:peptidoglycan DD-metalloendopeptidase family protein [Pseudoxanthomonas sp. PXM02]MBD9480431.1 peptidoglycan DD-metalloendopeptidase family protein [Pseudoxanthomonas sp. PXM02]